MRHTSNKNGTVTFLHPLQVVGEAVSVARHVSLQLGTACAGQRGQVVPGQAIQVCQRPSLGLVLLQHMLHQFTGLQASRGVLLCGPKGLGHNMWDVTCLYSKYINPVFIQ